MGTERQKDGASSKASPVLSGWQLSIWFSRFLDQELRLEKIACLPF
jgi:hypothetical protein